MKTALVQFNGKPFWLWGREGHDVDVPVVCGMSNARGVGMLAAHGVLAAHTRRNTR